MSVADGIRKSLRMAMLEFKVILSLDLLLSLGILPRMRVAVLHLRYAARCIVAIYSYARAIANLSSLPSSAQIAGIRG